MMSIRLVRPHSPQAAQDKSKSDFGECAEVLPLHLRRLMSERKKFKLLKNIKISLKHSNNTLSQIQKSFLTSPGQLPTHTAVTHRVLKYDTMKRLLSLTWEQGFVHSGIQYMQK